MARIYETDDAMEFDLKACFTDEPGQADLLVFENYGDPTPEPHIWSYVEDPDDAEYVVVFVDDPDDADILVHFVDEVSDAGLQNKSKARLFRA